jgi:DNA-directed RNA polymerase specialized sigma24 family protein
LVITALRGASIRSRTPQSLVELRYLAGLTVVEVSRLSGKSVRSVEREWERTV